MIARGVSEGRASEITFHNHRVGSWHPHRPERKGICSRTGIQGTVPSQGPKMIFKPITQHRIHPWQKLPTVSRRNFQPSDIIKYEHTQATRKPYLCSDCGKTFFMFLALRTHQRTHTDHERSHTRGADYTAGPVL